MARKELARGGRRPRGEYRGNSKILTVRVRPELRIALERAAKKHHRSLSQEMQRGLDAWVGRYNDPKLHIGALATAITLLVEGIERRTGKHWHKDVLTGEALRHGIDLLIFHFAPTRQDGMSMSIPLRFEEAKEMPPDIRGAADLGTSEAGMVITLIENAPALNKPPLGLAFTDERGLWQILRDLGSGWERNRDVWMPKEMRK